MNTTILTIGIGCIIAAIVGGGLKAFGMEIPALSSIKRQMLLSFFGVILVAGSFMGGAENVPTPATGTNQASLLNSATATTNRPNLTYGTWTLHNAIDEEGNDYSNSKLKFTSQEETAEGLALQGVFTWRLNNELIGTEKFKGQYVDRNRHIIIEGFEVAKASEDAQLSTSSYSIVLSQDERTLVEGRWGGTQQGQAAFNGNWEATR